MRSTTHTSEGSSTTFSFEGVGDLFGNGLSKGKYGAYLLKILRERYGYDIVLKLRQDSKTPSEIMKILG